MKTRVYLYVKALSDLGTMMDQMVLSVLVFTETGSNFWLAASLLLRTLGGMISSLYSGVLADRFDRKKLMVYSDLLRAVAILILIPFPNPVMICICTFLIGFLSSFFQVSFSAEVPKMFGEEQVMETNALISRLTYLGMLFGFIGTSLSDVIGYRMTLGYDCLTYLLSAVVLLALKWDVTAGHGSPAMAGGKMKQLAEDLREVKKYLKLHPVLMVVFVVYLVETYGAGSHNVGVPLLAQQLSPQHVALYQGFIWGTWAVGSVLITWVLPKIQWVKDRLVLSYFLVTVLMSLGFISYFSMSTPATIFPLVFLTGIFDASSGTVYAVIMQKSDNYIRGRIFGVSTLINRAGFCVGFVVVPLLLERLSLPHMVWLMHGTVITSLLVAIVYVYRTNRQAFRKVSEVEVQSF